MQTNKAETTQTTQIFITRDYSLFKKLKGNRNLNKLNLKKITRSIEKVHIPIPIVVNENYEIIDGQHRLEVCKNLGYPVYYIMIEGMTLDDVKLLNTNSQGWKLGDYLDSFCEEDNHTYLEVKSFVDEYGFSIVDSLTMLSNTKSNRGEQQEKFKLGVYNIKNKSKAIETADKMLEVKPYFPRYKSRSFFLAMSEMFHNKDYSHKKFIKKLSQYPTKLKPCSNKYEYLKNIEEIYNFNQKTKTRLF